MEQLIRSLLIAFCLAVQAPALAQYPITILPSVEPPYPSNYTDYFSDPAQVSILFTNTSDQVQYIYLAGSIGTIDGTVRVNRTGGVPWNAPPLEIPPGTRMVNGNELEPLLQGGGNVEYEGITEEQIILGQLPEGLYWLCLQAFNYQTNELLSAPTPGGCSPPFPIMSQEPPVTVAPACGEVVSAMQPQLVVFSWMLPQGIPAGSIVQYDFRIVRIWDAINAQNALESSTDVVYEETVFAPTLLYNLTMPALVDGQQYAWWVRATTVDGIVTFNNNGYSQPCTFTYRSEVQRDFAIVYPFEGDTLPWSNLPVMVRFEPHAAPLQTGRFHSRLRISKDGGPQQVTERMPNDQDILWFSGPFASQRYLMQLAGINTATFTEDEARHVNMYKSTIAPGEEFVHGSTYDLEGDVRIQTYEQTHPEQGEVSSRFVGGMGRPVPLAPADYLHIPRDTTDTTTNGSPLVKLRFRTAEPPVHLLPSFPIWIIPSEGPPTQTQAYVNERWRLQIARDPEFQQVVLSQHDAVGVGLELNSATCDEACARSQLYKEVEVNYVPADTGWYYWRVGWLKNTDDPTGATYHDGPVRRFHIDGDTLRPQQPAEEVRAPECLAESRRMPTPLAQRLPVSTIGVGDTVEVGLFRMRVTQISFSGTRASGQGIIDVPVMRAGLRVGFTNAQINAQKRLFDGYVNALYDNAGIIPQGWTVGGSLAAGLSPQAAAGIDQFLNTTGRLVSQFAGNTPMGLPIGIDTQVPEGRIVIGILAMQFTDTIAHLNAAMGLPMHGIGQTVGLGNMSIPFHPSGIGDASAEGTLYLLSDLNFPIAGDTLRLRGARFTNGFSMVQDSGTFVAWDCRGFRAFAVDAQWRFSQDRLREDLPNGEDGPNKIVASLKVRTGRAGLFGRVDFNKPWHLTGTKGYGFDVQEAWLDMASYMNPPDMDLPLDVATAVGLADEDSGLQLTTFEGFYLKRGLLRLPPEIQRTGSTERVSLVVDDVVINGTGVTGKIKGTGLIGPDEASLDGWGYSIDTLEIDIVTNSFHRAGMKGRIHLPITDTLLAYSAMFTHDLGGNDQYLEFLLQPQGTIKADFLLATLDLYPTSHLRAVMLRNDTAAYAKAVLNGKLSITGSMPGAGQINFRDIAFQGLYFQTRAPYTNADSSEVFSLASPQKYMGATFLPEDEVAPADSGRTGGFPVSITRVKVDRRNISGTPLAGIGFDINLQLTGSTNIFVATTRIAVLGELNTSSLHRWGHHSVELDSIGVRGEVGSVKIEGGLRWYNGDGIYGDGINGSAKAWFMKGALEVNAAVQFGNKDGLKYWFADAMVAKDNGFSPGSAFNIYGFGGGAWYHMKRNSPLPSAQQVTTAMIANQNDSTYTPGLTLSGVSYLPDASLGYGFQATMVFGDGASGHAYNGDLTAGMTLSASGGVNTAFLDGNVYLMTQRNDRTHVPIRGTAHIQYDFPNDVFSGLFDMYVSIGSGGMVTGTGANDLAGQAELLITPDTWHFFVGTPQTPIGLDFRGIFTTQAYFMVGEDLPSPLPPQNPAVQAIIPANYYVPMDLGNASGIAFGARGDVSDTLKYYLLRMRYGAGVGLDMAFTNASSMACPGNPSSGLNGWYATGQVYAYLSGAVSLHVDLWFAEGDYKIMDLSAATVLQGGFINPSWMRGVVGGQYSILGGAVSGSFSLPFEIGERCQPPTDGLLGGINPIGDIMPRHNTGIASGTAPVNCGVNPEATFNIRLDTEFTLQQMQSNGTTRTRTFRLKLDQFDLKRGTLPVVGRLEVASSKEQATLIPGMYLEPNTNHSVTVVVHAEERNPTTGIWATAMHQGQPVVWDSTVVFRTGAGLQTLTNNDIDYSYPHYRQRYVLQDECRSAIIQCKADLSNQPLFLPGPAGTVRIYKMMLTPRNGGATMACQAQVYHSGVTTVQYTLPPLLNANTYIAQLVSRDSTVQATGPFGGILAPIKGVRAKRTTPHFAPILP